MWKSGVRGSVFFRPGTWSRIFFAGGWAVLEVVVAAAISSLGTLVEL